MIKVRLTDQEISKITSSVISVSATFGLTVKAIAAFGSRTDLKKKGGDIDLFIEYQDLAEDLLFHLRRQILLKLYDTLGEQKIDIVINK